MSAAKRDQSAFRHRAAASPTAPTAKLQALNLELLDLSPPWGGAPKEGRDPYNAVGRRAMKNSSVGSSRR